MTPAKKSKKGPRELSPSHKAAMAEGRTQGRAVRAYLEALEANKPRRGRKRTPESISRRLAKIEQDLATADPLRRVQLVQEQLDLQAESASLESKTEIAGLEKGFVKAAKGYSERKGISFAAWRAVGVPTTVLKEAGITPRS